MAAIAAGNVIAPDRFYRRNRPAAIAVGCKCNVLHDQGGVEDVVLDAFLRFWHSASSFQSGE